MTADHTDREALQKRVLAVLALGQVVASAALAAAVTVGAFVIQEILGSRTPWAGIATATVTTGTAFMSAALARLMRGRGRRPGLQVGYLLAMAGGGGAALGAELQSLALFVAGLFVYGSGQAANLLSRYAATDLARPGERSRAMSRVVFASTFGAVLGPVLIGPAQTIGQDWFGFGRYTGPWLLSSLAFAAAFLNIALRLRPDPLVVAGRLAGEASPGTRPTEPAWRLIAARRPARIALGAMVASQSTMVAVMTMTPVHLRAHGHEGVSAYVISLHIAGMFVFSPLVGRYADRRGRVPAIVAGAGVLLFATALAGASGDVEQLLFPALWALGIGWNFGLIGGSSLLTEAVPEEARVGVQGAADLMMSLCGGIAGFSSGFVRSAFGYHVLSYGAFGVASVLLLAATGYDRAVRMESHGVTADVTADVTPPAALGDLVGEGVALPLDPAGEARAT